MEKFYLDQYLAFGNQSVGVIETCGFYQLSQRINQEFLREWEEKEEQYDSVLRIQKKAIIGYQNEVSYFKEKINELIGKFNAENTSCPGWYESLEDGIYHENWGLAGIAEWFSHQLRGSSSAKIIGSRIYFLENGEMKLKQQTITKERRDQMIRAFLLHTPEERLDKDYHEVYMLDGTRITIFGGTMTKKEQDVIIFRRYIVPIYRFEEQASRGTIPVSAIRLFQAMVRIGYNVAFLGAVRTAKTTFLTTWQSYEDKSLEGVMVETDPEIPLHKLMPEAPILQLIADHEKLKHISKSLLRSDADYFILAEARDGIALDTALKLASKGTKRMKITFHSRDPMEFCFDVAGEIMKSLGGDYEPIVRKAAASFDYVFHFVQLKNKNQKRLKSIHELSLDDKTRQVSMTEICRYNYQNDNWEWNYHIGMDKKLYGEEECPEEFRTFSSELASLAEMQRTVSTESIG